MLDLSVIKSDEGQAVHCRTLEEAREFFFAVQKQRPDVSTINWRSPHVHFIVYGEGEESGDIWEHHYLNGMHQTLHAKIVMPEFDPNGWRESKHVQDIRTNIQELPQPDPNLDILALLN